MTIEQVAVFLRLSESTVKAQIDSGNLKTDGEFILAAQLIEFIEANTTD